MRKKAIFKYFSFSIIFWYFIGRPSIIYFSGKYGAIFDNHLIFDFFNGLSVVSIYCYIYENYRIPEQIHRFIIVFNLVNCVFLDIETIVQFFKTTLYIPLSINLLINIIVTVYSVLLIKGYYLKRHPR